MTCFLVFGVYLDHYFEISTPYLDGLPIEEHPQLKKSPRRNISFSTKYKFQKAMSIKIDVFMHIGFF